MIRAQTIRCMIVTGIGLTQTLSAYAAPAWKPSGKILTWSDGSTITFDRLDCSESGYSGVVVAGTVTLVASHPTPTSPKTIQLNCPFMVFQSGAELLTKEELNIRISTQISGPVKIINTRGETGSDASPRPDLWAVTKQPQAKNGDTGPSGRNAETDFKGDWHADDGGTGGNGDHGARGVDGSPGEPGRGGTSAARIQLKVAAFADGSTIYMHALGGDGGIGGKGGRGQDGGRGGNGGTGGHGGDGNATHDGASGGNGGNGGDGGDGGNGGPGGSGGPGGNGADVVLFILNGGQAPAEIDMSANGGFGGRGGEGGDFGLGGLGGIRGEAGCGGSGGTFIWHTGSGGCGTNGLPGQNGKNGLKGPPGNYGTDGSPGNILHIILQYVPPSEF